MPVIIDEIIASVEPSAPAAGSEAVTVIPEPGAETLDLLQLARERAARLVIE